MRKLLYSILTLVLFISACNKIDFDKTVTGEALGNFKISQPSNNTDLRLNAAMPEQTVVISWTASKPGRWL